MRHQLALFKKIRAEDLPDMREYFSPLRLALQTEKRDNGNLKHIFSPKS